jgi:(2Fe-2S) ferredoxin
MLKTTAVVMAPHGKGRMKEFFVGSVCNHCLHRCEAPLVMVRPERVDADGVKKKTSDAAVISTAEGATQTADGAVGGKVTNGDGREAVGVSA